MSDLIKVPQSLLDKSQIIRKYGEINKINSMIADLPKMLQRNIEILEESKKLLEEEERSDINNRNVMNDKWTRTPSVQLTESLNSEIKQYEKLINKAVNANKIIENKYTKNLGYIDLLSKSANEIASAISIAALQNSHEFLEFRGFLNEIEKVKNVRKVLEYKMNSNDVDALNIKLIKNSNSIDEVVNNELKELIEPMRKQVCENIQGQEKLLGLIEIAYSKFQINKAKITDEMLKNLESACDSYNDLNDHLEEAFNFFNDLFLNLLKFKSKVDDFVFARKIEENDLMGNV
jgi:programmed cell death 6-interacting protein